MRPFVYHPQRHFLSTRSDGGTCVRTCGWARACHRTGRCGGRQNRARRRQRTRGPVHRQGLLDCDVPVPHAPPRRSSCHNWLPIATSSAGSIAAHPDRHICLRWVSGDASPGVATADRKTVPHLQRTGLANCISSSNPSSFCPAPQDWTELDSRRSLHQVRVPSVSFAAPHPSHHTDVLAGNRSCIAIIAASVHWTPPHPCKNTFIPHFVCVSLCGLRFPIIRPMGPLYIMLQCIVRTMAEPSDI